MAETYNHQEIDQKWQTRWQQEQTFLTPDAVPGDATAYILDFFPYPSGAGLHVGHLSGYTGSDVLARVDRKQGTKVLHPMGWDAFGLPAENYAIKSGVHPAISTATNIQRYKEQLIKAGMSYDWSKEINSSDPEYYRWSQWLFELLYKRGLAYRKYGFVNWCPSCQTVLANEQVVGGACDRCGTTVVQRQLKQWYFKITDYAERLLSGLDSVDWPEKIKSMQRNWIGKSEGAQLFFSLPEREEKIEVFTTRPDTIFGATFLVLAPEHPLVESLITPEQQKDVHAYRASTSEKTELERTFTDRPKTGVFTGSYAVNPATGEQVPIWIADYVLVTYGTGAIMAVPAHDERDFAFATTYSLPVIQVIAKKSATARSYLMGASAITDEDLKALRITLHQTLESGSRLITIPNDVREAYEKLIAEKLTPGFWNEYVGAETVFLFKENDGTSKRLVLTRETEREINELAARFNNRQSDLCTVWQWLAANEWYAPEIIHHEQGTLINSGVFTGRQNREAIDDLLQHINGTRKITYRLRDWLISRQRFWGAPIPVAYDPDGKEYLLPEDQLPLTLPEQVEFRPTGQSPLVNATEWNTFTDEATGTVMKRETDTMDGFMCSSWYYLRFPTPHLSTAAFDAKSVKTWLPVDIYMGGAEHAVLHLLYARFFTKVLYDAGLVDFDEPFQCLRNQGMILGPDHNKMSKSKGNVINPDDVLRQHGADTLRTYELFMAPFEVEKPWSVQGIVGVRRFLDKVWKLQTKVSGTEPTEAELRCIHPTIAKVTTDIQDLRFNTAISTLMEAANALSVMPNISQFTYELLLTILNPFAPHLTDEIWQAYHAESICSLAPWPVADQRYMQVESIEYPVQINGKVRAKIIVSPDVSEAEIIQLALAEPKVQEYIAGHPIKKQLVVPGRLVTFAI